MTPAQTPERPVTWSDADIHNAVEAVDGKRYPVISYRFYRSFLSTLGAVHPQEAAIARREAERTAYANGCVDEAVAGPRIEYRYPKLSLSLSPLVPEVPDELTRGVAYFEAKAREAREAFERAPEVGKNVGNCASDGAAWVALCRERYVVALNELARAKGSTEEAK